MALIKFLETDVKIDSSKVSNIGTTGEFIITLTKDQRQAFTDSGIGTASSLVIKVYDELNAEITLSANLPYTPSLTKSTDGAYYYLKLLFDKAVSQINFGFARTIKITNGTDTDFSLIVEVNRTPGYSYLSWNTNSNENLTIAQIPLKARLLSIDANSIFRSILNGAINALNQVKYIIDKYQYTKYLPDIIDFAIYGGNANENSSSVVTRDVDGDITTLITTYAVTGRRAKIKVTYTYDNSTYTTNRVTDANADVLPAVAVKVLTDIQVDALDGSSAVIFTIGKVTLTRTETVYNIPNALPNYKKYKYPMITGWTTTV